ncbi:dihydroorotase [Sphingopyxis alaskensis]|jgi:dihydroorotase|uniref:Dihydroorotase n=1 Tax=Sphingopyxis alaskensis (strain DSM 13593 / LMG 18877 / RB2256) TaxID=317655 RepID=Q1GUN1_SPHAL|nr:dihydroorotase [Sphingopyxis alaskensis]ABF52641.1 dihydroorotase [Sphingopyxis alaskensis RB2256]MCM3418174.1 dihydroorotase [Sphingopyxis alaskensis]
MELRPLHIANALLVDGDTPRPGSLLAVDGRIAAIDPADIPEGAETVDARGQWLAPGIIDLGVFATDKPAFHFGGITRAALMPDNGPLDGVGLVERAAKGGKPDLWVHPLAAATKGLEGRELAEIGLMKQAGARAVATGRARVADSGVMRRVLAYAASLGLVTIIHAEDEGLTAGAVATDGEMATRLGLSSAPAIAEAMAIARDLSLVEETGAPVHFRQVTTARGLDLIRAAKAKGLPVLCGITPAHLFLSDTAIGDFRTFARLSPPLRSEDDRRACLAAVVDGTIDVLSSGHDPRGPEDKRLPFAEALPGMAGAETLLAMGLNLVRDGHITPGRLFEMLAAIPACLLGVDAGRLVAGGEADLILVDPDIPWQVDAKKMATWAGNTPFDGMPVQGRATMMWKGGKRIR